MLHSQPATRPMRYNNLSTDGFQCKTHWEHGLLPETVTVEFNFRISANMDELVALNGISNIEPIVKDNLGVNAITKIANGIKLKKLKHTFSLYNWERTDDSISLLLYRVKKDVMFGFYVQLEAKDPNLVCSADEVNADVADFVNQFAPKYFGNKKIAKYFTLSR